ncbi:hypothetical protein CASFOL_031502 [Castilleja foliolosa]|uniref:Uncharacterized protein n=1 Tax=Castilleja foliolosa TaxID=1961234 RepID=A0ABD3C693_9LAMI
MGVRGAAVAHVLDLSNTLLEIEGTSGPYASESQISAIRSIS